MSTKGTLTLQEIDGWKYHLYEEACEGSIWLDVEGPPGTPNLTIPIPDAVMAALKEQGEHLQLDREDLDAAYKRGCKETWEEIWNLALKKRAGLIE